MGSMKAGVGHEESGSSSLSITDRLSSTFENCQEGPPEVPREWVVIQL